jgi:hypothetical protein
MNPRERTLAIVIGAALAVLVIYHGINYLFIRPVREADVQVAALTQEQKDLDGKIASREMLARRWLKYVGQTFSFDPTDALDRLGVELKEIAKRHGFEGAVFQIGTGTSIGSKSGIKTVAHRIIVDGTYAEVISFLRDIYDTPYMCQITKLSISPMESKVGRNMVKLECTVETPVLPQVDKKKIGEAASARPMPNEPEKALPPFREHLRGDEAYQVFNERNIFRAYEPPPTNIVAIENQDWKDVVATITFYWDNKVTSEQVKMVASKANVSVEGKGDIAEVAATYADGKTFGPKRFDFGAKKDWAFQVAMHHPAPPPELIDLAVDNKHAAAIQLEVKVNGKDGKQKTEPAMVFEPGRNDVREYRDVQNITVTAKYASGKHWTAQTFSPSNHKQTYNVPPEPQEAVPTGPAEPVVDTPPDPAYTVTALLTYEQSQEMVATSQSERKVIHTGEPGAVDGGMLLGIHPLGGVVRMPTGNYYLYPLGRKFTQRVKLVAGCEAELSEAIDAWSRD